MTGKTSRFISFVLSAVLLFVSVTAVGIVSAAQAVSITAATDKASYNAGDTATLTVSVANLTEETPIAAMDFYIEFDSSIFSVEKSSSNVVSVTAGNALSSADDLSVSSPKDGILKVLYFGDDSASIGTLAKSGTLFSLPLTVSQEVAAGSYTVSMGFAPSDSSLEEGQACDMSATPIEVVFENATVSVVTASYTNPYSFVPSYEDKGYISGFAVGNTAAAVKQSFEASGGATVTVKDAAGAAVSDSSAIATGMTITVSGVGEDVVFTAVVYGDVDGNGSIDSMDAAQFNANLAFLSDPEGPYAVAFDLDKSGSVDAMDKALMNAYLAFITDISQ